MPKAKGQKHYNWKHGLSRSRVYFVWIEMRQRCGNPNHKHFDLYGRRGIQVCHEWQDFRSFYSWAISNGYQAGLSIERKDNDGNYSPDNCKWVGQKEQTDNTRRSKLISYNGQTKSLRAWADSLGENYNTLRSRLRIGWLPNKVLEVPTGKKSEHTDSCIRQ